MNVGREETKTEENRNQWMLDTGAIAHVMNDSRTLTNLQKCYDRVHVGLGTTLVADFKGEVAIEISKEVQNH